MQDTVKTDKFTYKTNAISLYSHNEELQKLCVENDGKYVCTTRTIKGKEVMTTISKEGKVVLEQ